MNRNSNPYLRTGEKHKDWYKSANLGKQRVKPKIPLDQPKEPGTRYHSTRKEKTRGIAD